MIGRVGGFPPGVLAIPVTSWMWSVSARALLTLSHSLPPGSSVGMTTEGPSSSSANRNRLIEEFLRDETFRWILFVDSDMEPPARAAFSLLCSAAAVGADVIAALCYSRQQPYRLAAAEIEELPEDKERIKSAADMYGVRKANAVGMGCTLIQRHVLETLRTPWFESPPDKPGTLEDYVFCEKARKAGFNVYIDCDLEVGHVGVTSIGREFAGAWYSTPAGREQLK